MSEQTIFPALRYHDAPAAIEFIESAFGFERGTVSTGDDGRIQHAELSYEGATLMLGTAQADSRRPGGDLLTEPSTLYLAVADPDEHYAQAAAAGARVIHAPYDTPYGSREYSVSDPGGHVWSFGTYRP